jgi:hypothetical protein
MEAGRTDDLTVLTPSELHWIENALGPRDRMARKILENGKSRPNACTQRGDAGEACGKAATHFILDTGSETFTGYCAEHWRTGIDPGNVLKLHDADEPATALPAE